MEYVFGTKGKAEILKTKGSTHTDLTGYHQIEREYPDQTLTDHFRVVSKLNTAEDAEGNCYDWYEIDHHYRMTDKTSGLRGELKPITDLVHTVTTQSDKLGFDWVETYVGDIIVKKEYIEQENPVGTSADNPIEYTEGVELIDNAFYLVGGSVKVWMGEWVDWE